MLPDLPSPLLRSFVAVVDCGSLAAAAARVGRSESALSLQMSRLEDIVGKPLFDRDGRALRINQVGSNLLAHSRAILGYIDVARAQLEPSATLPARIGIVQDFVDQVLRLTLKDLRTEDPKVSFEIVIGSTTELLQALGEDRIDTALCAGELPGTELISVFPMAWFGQENLLDEDVVPLLSITPPCPFLTAAQHALDAIGRPWRIAMTTPSLDGLRAATSAGLGIACRTATGIELPALNDPRLPILPKICYSVVERRKAKDGPGLVATKMSKYLTRRT